MKSFYQLSPEQQYEAINVATTELKSLLQEGIIDFGHGDQLNDRSISYYAKAAAEGSYYTEKGDRVIDGITG